MRRTKAQLRDDVRRWLAERQATMAISGHVNSGFSNDELDELIDIVRDPWAARNILDKEPPDESP